MIGTLLGKLAERVAAALRYASVAESHLAWVPLARGTRVTAALIDLNYLGLSPFADPLVVYQTRGEELLLWFVRPGPPAWFVVPEALALARALAAGPDPKAILLRRDDGVEIVLARQGAVLSQLHLTPAADGALEKTLGLLRREHRLGELEELEISAEKRTGARDRGLALLGWRDLRGCRVLHDAHRQGLRSTLKLGLRLAVVSLLLFISLDVLGAYFVRSSLERMRQDFATLQREIGPLLRQREEAGRLIDFWRGFQAAEMRHATPGELYGVIGQAALRSEARLERFGVSGGQARISVLLADPAQLAEELRGLPDCKVVRFEGTVRQDKKSGLQEADLVCELLPPAQG